MTNVTPAALAAFARVTYLGGLPPAELEALAARASVRRLRKGTTIFEAGDPARALNVVLEGRVALVRRSAQGREQVLHTEGPGASLGEGPLFDGGGYVGSAMALEDACVLTVPREAILDLCRRRPEVAIGIITVLAGRLRSFAGLVEDLSLRAVGSRLARLLLREVEIRGGCDVVQLPGTREAVAMAIGTVRERVSRSLSQLSAAGIIRVSGRSVRVLDRDRLVAWAEDGPSR